MAKLYQLEETRDTFDPYVSTVKNERLHFNAVVNMYNPGGHSPMKGRDSN